MAKKSGFASRRHYVFGSKMPFAYGLGNTSTCRWQWGCRSLSDTANAFDVIADINRYRPTILHGIPALYAGMLAAQEITPLDVSSIRLCASAAEQLPSTIWHKWEETYGIKIYEGIGTTELLHIFLSNRPGECRPGSSGRPVAGYDVQIVDKDGLPFLLAKSVTCRCGKSLMMGYWNRLRETREALYGETMLTGDKYLCDADGYFSFMGRKDDFFKVNGQWVSPLKLKMCCSNTKVFLMSLRSQSRMAVNI
jgi:acyl-coenzyme A synthetase/AMP-(fatty) acid ligase